MLWVRRQRTQGLESLQIDLSNNEEKMNNEI